MANNRILRFHAPDKVFHSLNAITWFALLFTGAYVYFCEPSAEAAEANMIAHLILGAIFTFNLLGFIVVAPDRFALILRACLEWDRNTIYWFRNFGGYPRRFFKIPFGPVEVPPQGRYNGGQKASYLLFMGMIAALAVTGWSALDRRPAHRQAGLCVDVLLPRLGLDHRVGPRRVRPHPARSPFDGTLQGHLAPRPGYDLVRSRRTPCSDLAGTRCHSHQHRKVMVSSYLF